MSMQNYFDPMFRSPYWNKFQTFLYRTAKRHTQNPLTEAIEAPAGGGRFREASLEERQHFHFHPPPFTQTLHTLTSLRERGAPVDGGQSPVHCAVQLVSKRVVKRD